jgi:hypothetical protein
MTLWVQYTDLSRPPRPWLFTEGGVLKFDIELLPLEPGEYAFPDDEDRGYLKLRQGRWLNFNEVRQEHYIQLPDIARPSNRPYFSFVDEYVAWINENTRAEWHMEVTNPVGRRSVFSLDFSFEDVKEAIHFKMRWYG